MNTKHTPTLYESRKTIAELIVALEGMLPTNTGYCNSMDWQRYDTAVHFAKIALAKAKGE